MFPPCRLRASCVICVAFHCLAPSSSLAPRALARHRGNSNFVASIPRRFVGVSRDNDVGCGTKNARPRSLVLRSLGSNVGSETNQQLLESLRSMRVKELKAELASLNVSTQDAFEKEELVQRLYNARIAGVNSGSVGVANVESKKKKKKKKKRRRYDDDETVGETTNMGDTNTDADTNSNYDANASNTVSKNGWTITTPFTYYDVGSSKPVASTNAEDVYIQPAQGKYAAIKVQLTKGQSSSIEWTLLVDTACSGLVLSPDAVAAANQQCPGMVEMVSNTGATLTSAGSSQGAAVAKWDSYAKMVVGGVEVGHSNVAACQDIGALPPGLDGILGLSFLDQFACVDFDFINDELRLERTDPSPLIPNMNDVVAQGQLSLTKLRIYYADMTLDGRGPVKLLVDTGAASSFLNWKGVSDMKLSSSSPQIEPIQGQFGAMGADNMAMQLTHRFKLKRRWNVVAENNAVGDFCPGIGLRDNQVSNIDISDLPVLETLKGDGVGGILGADLFMMCDVVRFRGLNGGSPTMILMKQQ